MGILIAIDGVDGSGKQTQTKLLYDRLKNYGKNVRLISFPAYESQSSVLIKMYLNGDFGHNPGDVNPYAASTFFAADRYATYKSDWKKDYDNGVIIIADRYVSSNMIHQAGKMIDQDEKDKFLEWIYDFEYNKLELPKPKITAFLDMPIEYGIKLISERANKIDGSDAKDIHESDIQYLKQSYNNANNIADKFNWNRIKCIKDGHLRSIDEINNELFELVIKNI